MCLTLLLGSDIGCSDVFCVCCSLARLVNWMARNECFWASSQLLFSQSLFDPLVGLGHCMLLVVSSHSGFMFLPVHHCCGRSRLGGHAGQFCAITALARHLFCGNALQGKGFASAESATCSTFMFAPFFFCFAHS